ADDVEAGEASEYVNQLAAVEPAHLRGAGAWGEGRIKHVDVDRDVDGCIAHSTSDGIDRAVDADDVEIPGADDPESEAGVVREIELVVDMSTNAHVDRLLLREQPPLDRSPEHGPVR